MFKMYGDDCMALPNPTIEYRLMNLRDCPREPLNLLYWGSTGYSLGTDRNEALAKACQIASEHTDKLWLIYQKRLNENYEIILRK